MKNYWKDFVTCPYFQFVCIFWDVEDLAKKPTNYCKICSRVRHNDYYDVDKFSDVHSTSFPSYLDILSEERVDFDVFLCKPSFAFCSLCHPNSSDKKWAYFEVFNYARDLFAAFCDVLVRMNYTMGYFSEFISNISLSDEAKIIRKIFKFACDLLNNFFNVNHCFFYEFFDLFAKVNASDCYVIYNNKPKYGPYQGPRATLEFSFF